MYINHIAKQNYAWERQFECGLCYSSAKNILNNKQKLYFIFQWLIHSAASQ